MSALNQLRTVRDQLRRQLEANEVFIAWLAADKAVKTVENQLNASTCSVPEIEDRPWLPTVVEQSIKLLERFGEPLTTEKIYSELVKLGVNFTGQVPVKNTRSALSRSKEFRSVRTPQGPKWWLSDRPYPGEAINGSARPHEVETETAGPHDQ